MGEKRLSGDYKAGFSGVFPGCARGALRLTTCEGKHGGKNPVNALQRASPRREGARKNQPLVFIHFLSFAGLNST